MIYVVSDIHGCYDKYIKMLDKINFSVEDTLYILGDVVDRGENGMRVLLDVAKRKNVILLRGNHDEQARMLLSNVYMLEEENCPKELIEMFGLWLSDGGETTLKEFLNLSEEDKVTIIETLNNSLISIEIRVNGNDFLLAHTVPEVDVICDYEDWDMQEYMWGEPDYEEIYFDDKYIVTGHTPTGYIDVNYRGKIWKRNNHIAIDCGAVYGNPLGCMCLDTFEEFYVE